MKICFVGPANSTHIVKWCIWFHNRGHETHVVSFTPGEIMGTQVHLIHVGVDVHGSDINKLKYLLTGKKIRNIIKDIKPDVINAHYATSYGMAIALSGIKNYILSVWGSDIYSFPQKSLFHKWMLQYNIRKAVYLFSTSQAMADEARKYTDRDFIITPFGVDMNLFCPQKQTRETGQTFTIGTVKTLSAIYGIDLILHATKKIRTEHPEVNIRVRIAGDGPQAEDYQKLSSELGIENIVTFLGRITQAEAANEWANMDVAVIPSVLYESFGVAAVEAQASGTPVVISDVGGLMETTIPGKTSIVVARKDSNAIADAIMELYYNPALRLQMGIEGRRNVVEKYELNQCFEEIERFFIEFAGREE